MSIHEIEPVAGVVAPSSEKLRTGHWGRCEHGTKVGGRCSRNALVARRPVNSKIWDFFCRQHFAVVKSTESVAP